MANKAFRRLLLGFPRVECTGVETACLHHSCHVLQELKYANGQSRYDLLSLYVLRSRPVALGNRA